MYNTDLPDRADLPGTAKLIRSTVVAGVVSIVILVTIVLPSEYGIDPTRVGGLLGLTPMGEIKMQLAAEADAEAKVASAPVVPSAVTVSQAVPTQEQAALVKALDQRVAALEALVTPAAPIPQSNAVDTALVEPAPLEPTTAPEAAASPWRDEISFTLTPGQGTEYKLVMNAGAIATFEFFTQGGVINFDQHGEGEGQSISYEVVRGVEGDSGTMQAPVAGTHGWFFRNRGTSDVTVTLRTGGDYIELRKLI
jgi:hypothetical protein